MFINDDGMQIIDEEERRARIDFYADHSIGWTARPKHGANGFTRKGKFKKVCRRSISSILSLFQPATLGHKRCRCAILGLCGNTISSLLHEMGLDMGLERPCLALVAFFWGDYHRSVEAAPMALSG